MDRWDTVRHVYSIARFVPDPANGEFVNIGILVGSETSGEWMLRTTDDTQRAKRLGKPSRLKSVIVQLNQLRATLEEPLESANLDQERLLRGYTNKSERWLDAFCSDHLGILQFSSPQPINADNSNQAVQLLWDKLIVSVKAREYRYPQKRLAVGAVHEAFLNAQLDESYLWRSKRMDVAGARAQIDFAIHNGAASHLTQCWSFQRLHNDRLLREIQAWAWAIRSLRRHGGVFVDGSDEMGSVARDAELAIVYVPPVDEGSEQAFESAMTTFEDPELGAGRVVDYANAEDVAKDAFEMVGYPAFSNGVGESRSGVIREREIGAPRLAGPLSS